MSDKSKFPLYYNSLLTRDDDESPWEWYRGSFNYEALVNESQLATEAGFEDIKIISTPAHREAIATRMWQLNLKLGL